jgi:hypothetical protein
LDVSGGASATSGARVMIKMIISSGYFQLNVASKPWIIIIICILRVLYTEVVEVQFCEHEILQTYLLEGLTAVLVSYPEITWYVTVCTILD